MTTRTLYTIGHSNHKLEIFLSYLKDYQITHLIDVRTTPQSRWNPQYNRNSLNTSLQKEGIEYNHLGNALGGKPKWVEEEWLKGKACDRDYTEFFFRDDFKQGVRRVLLSVWSAAPNGRTAIMCSEGNPRDCHRHYMIANWVLSNRTKTEVRHIWRNGDLEYPLRREEINEYNTRMKTAPWQAQNSLV